MPVSETIDAVKSGNLTAIAKGVGKTAIVAGGLALAFTAFADPGTALKVGEASIGAITDAAQWAGGFLPADGGASVMAGADPVVNGGGVNMMSGNALG